MKKKENIENVVCNIIDKNVEVVGVPSDQWMRVEASILIIENKMIIILLKVQKIILKRKRLISLKSERFIW